MTVLVEEIVAQFPESITDGARPENHAGRSVFIEIFLPMR
jgi:hypothetical protein